MKLTFYLPDSEPKIFSVPKHCLIVGRSSSCDIPLVVEGISRQHCKIEYKNGEVFLTDLGSTNGVFIDGRRIQPKTPIRYQTFLPLSIGAIPNVMIELPENSRFETEQLLPKAEVLRVQSESLTRTKLMTRNYPKRNSKSTEPKKGSEKSSLINILAFLIFAGGLYYFFITYQNEENTQPPPSQSGPTTINDNGHF